MLKFDDDVYVGLFVCAHNKDVVEKASFDNVRIVVPAQKILFLTGISWKPYRNDGCNDRKRKILYSEHISLFRRPTGLKMVKSLSIIPMVHYIVLISKACKPALFPTGKVKRINNDHVISFDGKMLGISAASPDGKIGSTVYTVSINGGEPKLITPLLGFSYLHGMVAGWEVANVHG